MEDGIIFVWTVKHLIHEMVKYFTKQNFVYVENMCWVTLDHTKRQGKCHLLTSSIEVEDSGTIDVVPAFYKQDSKFF